MKRITSLFLVFIIVFSNVSYSAFADNKISPYDYNAAKPLIESHDVISFDIFDTLLVRPYAEPKDAVDHYKKLKETDKFKGTLKLESDFERIILQPHSENVELFNYAKSLGKKVIIISDMYINSKKLTEILNKNGIDGWEKMYVSCEINKSKASGDLFDYVLEDLKINPETVLHIGDNMHSDCKMAESRGIHSFNTPKIIDRLFEREPRTKIYYENHKGDLTASIFLGTMALSVLNHNDNYWNIKGSIYLGPICYAYTKWLKTQFEKDGIEKALFISRDCYSIHKIFELIKGDSNIESEYFYAPRGVYAICTPERKDKSVTWWKTVLGYGKCKNEILKNKTPNPLPETVEECEKFVSDNAELYQKIAEEEKAEYKKYLDGLNLENKKFALIDATSGNYTALKLLNLFYNKENFKGYYFTQRSNSNSYNFNISGFMDRYINHITAEYIMFAPEPHVLRIENNKPVYGRNLPIYFGKRAKMEEGIQSFAKNAERSFAGINIDFNRQSIVDFEEMFWIPNSKEEDKVKGVIFKTENRPTIEKLWEEWSKLVK